MTARSVQTQKLKDKLVDLHERADDCWKMAAVFLKNRDAHGLMDIGAELQSLRIAMRAVRELMPDHQPDEGA